MNMIFFPGHWMWVQVKLEGPEYGPGPHPFHTPVPYLLEGSVPYLCSIPLFYIYLQISIYLSIYIYSLYVLYIYINMYLHTYIYIYIFVYTHTHTIFLYMSAHERTYIHECIHARIRLLFPSPVSVLATLCLQH